MSTETPWSGLMPGPEVSLEICMISTIISAFACGLVLSLSISCFQLVYRKFCQQSGLTSKRMHLFLLGYITVMTSISLFHLIADGVYVTKSIFALGQLGALQVFQDRVNSVCMSLSIWGVDGFLLWRVLRLYADLSGLRRAAFIGFLVLLSLASLAIGGFTIFTFSPIDVFYPSLAIVTVLVNLILATLIVVRILNYQRQISKLLGKAYGSPYTRIISICVESCALITIIYLLFLFFVFLHPFSSWWTARMLTVYASVFSPILVIKRVAQGNDAVALVVESMNIPMTLTDAELEQARSGQITTIQLCRSEGASDQ